MNSIGYSIRRWVRHGSTYLRSPKTLVPLSAAFSVAVLYAVWIALSAERGVAPVSLPTMIFVSVLSMAAALSWPRTLWRIFIALLPMELTVFAVLSPIEISVRPYQVIGAALFFATIIRHGHRLRWQHLRLPDMAVILWVTGSILAAVVSHRPEAVDAVVSSALWYTLARIYVHKARDVREALQAVLSGAVVVMIIAIGQVVSGATLMDARAHGTFPEPNWLGLYAATIVALALAALMVKRRRNTRRVMAVVLTLSMTALILSVTRSAWLAAGTALVVGIYLHYRYGDRTQWRELWQLPVTALIVAVAAGVMLSDFSLSDRVRSLTDGTQTITVACDTPDAAKTLPSHIATVEELASTGCRHIRLQDRDSLRAQGMIIHTVRRNDPSIGTRQEIYHTVADTLRSDPIRSMLGWGFGGIDLGRDARGTTLNSSNLFIEALIGGGILGAVGIGVLWGWAMSAIARTVRHVRKRRSYAIPMNAALIAVFIGNLFNAGIFLAFPWVLLGVAVAIVPTRFHQHL